LTYKSCTFGYALTELSVQGISITTESILSLGMSKGDVISILGEPDPVDANSGAEYPVYNLSEKTGASKAVGCSAVTLLTFGMGAVTCSQDKEDFFVRLIEGAVDAYG
jgi:hypothetical protein